MADPVVEFCETVVEAWLFEKYPKVEEGVIKWDPFFGGDQTIKPCKSMVIFRDVPYNSALFGLVI